MAYSNRRMILFPLGLMLMIGTPCARSEIEKDVYVRGGSKWTAYDVPPSGANLTLNVRKGQLNDLTAPPIRNSRIRVEDQTDGDMIVWKRMQATGDVHVYKILGVSPGHEWVAIEGECGVAGASGVTGGKTGDTGFEVGVVKAEIEEPDGLPVKTVVEGDSRFRANPSCFEWQFVHVSNEVVTYYATQKPKGLVAPMPPAKYNWSVSAGTLNNGTVDTPTYVPNGPIPTLSAPMITVSLQLRPILGSDVGKQERTLEIYRDHLARDYQNFGVGITCGAGDPNADSLQGYNFHWAFSRYGVTVLMPHRWNCHGSVWHARDGTHDGSTSGLPSLGFSVPIQYDDPIPWSDFVLDLKRGDIVSFWTYDAVNETEQLQHSHTCMGQWDQMYGANNEPAAERTLFRIDPVDGHAVGWVGTTWRWWMTDSEKYYNQVNTDWQNSFNPPSNKKIINRVKVYKRL